MNSQFPPLNNQEDQQQQQQQPKQQPPPQQNTIQQYPIFYIKPNTFPIPNIQQQNTIDHYNSWFVCHPVMPDDPYLSYLSQLSSIIQKPQTFQNEVPIKLEVDEVIVKPLIQNQANLKQQRLQQLQNQTKIKQTDHAIGSNIQFCKCSQSSCLKRYCQCFQSGRKCLDKCQCIDCKNCSQFSQERDSAINKKFQGNIPSDKQLSQQNNNGCKCRSTGCLKKYCECFKKGQKCLELCSCQDCQNISYSISSKDEVKKKINLQNN
ncbi:unnamed protein product [Paramecium pentaurelia]|uniref:CRC domain-containing protein n=1 Tax=Paramecium pentaurelia TaxID=43138 RepID=A0A8S1TAN1_9CILI|nr:unnamed protein product [Paramecium pentaurelia]